MDLVLVVCGVIVLPRRVKAATVLSSFGMHAVDRCISIVGNTCEVLCGGDGVGAAAAYTIDHSVSSFGSMCCMLCSGIAAAVESATVFISCQRVRSRQQR